MAKMQNSWPRYSTEDTGMTVRYRIQNKRNKMPYTKHRVQNGGHRVHIQATRRKNTTKYDVQDSRYRTLDIEHKIRIENRKYKIYSAECNILDIEH